MWPSAHAQLLLAAVAASTAAAAAVSAAPAAAAAGALRTLPTRVLLLASGCRNYILSAAAALRRNVPVLSCADLVQRR